MGDVRANAVRCKFDPHNHISCYSKISVYGTYCDTVGRIFITWLESDKVQMLHSMYLTPKYIFKLNIIMSTHISQEPQIYYK